MPLVRVNMEKPLPPLKWVVGGLIINGYINMIASLPGEGKTAALTGLCWQASRPHSGRFLGRTVLPTTSIYVDYDAPGDGRTVRFWLDKHQRAYPDGDKDKIILLEPDADTYGMTEPELLQLVGVAKDNEVGLVIIDSFMSAFPGTDPIKMTQVQGPLWHLRRFANETGAAVLLIDHLPKPMMGESAGARGIIGSVAKPAQSRAVHVLSRVPPKEVQGRNVLRWQCQKMSYAAIPEPFAMELRFDANDVVFIDVADLPEGHEETRTEKALRAMLDHLEANRGLVIGYQELLKIAITAGNLRTRAAQEAVRGLKDRLGDELVVIELPGKGAPQGYKLKPISDNDCHTATNGENTVADEE